MNNTEVMDTDVPEEIDDHWDQSSIRIMLNAYLQNLDKFRNPKMKKKNVWIDIANAVGKGPDSCDKKFRNLKQTYIRLLKKKNKSEIVSVKWPYFDIFEQIYSADGEYQPDIQQKIQEDAAESVAKALLSVTEPTYEPEIPEISDTNGQSDESRRRLTRKRYTDFRKVAVEMRNRQRVVEEKLDRLINIVQESNSIQRERNQLFQQFLDSLQQQNSPR